MRLDFYGVTNNRLSFLSTPTALPIRSYISRLINNSLDSSLFGWSSRRHRSILCLLRATWVKTHLIRLWMEPLVIAIVWAYQLSFMALFLIVCSCLVSWESLTRCKAIIILTKWRSEIVLWAHNACDRLTIIVWYKILHEVPLWRLNIPSLLLLCISLLISTLFSTVSDSTSHRSRHYFRVIPTLLFRRRFWNSLLTAIYS